LTALVFWSFLLSQSGLVVSPQDCPAAATVDARVRDILGLSAEARLDERATIAREGASLRVTVRSSDDRVLGDRLLQADGDCNELAGAVAVVMAAYISDVHPEYLASLPANAAPVPLSPHLNRDAGAAPVPRGVDSLRHFRLGLALGAEFSGAGAVPSGALGAAWLPAHSGFGFAASATINGARQTQLSNGTLRYFRWPLTLGPAFRVPASGVELDLQAGPAVAWLHLEGVDFSPSASKDTFGIGGFAAARVSASSGAFAPFAELKAIGWQHTEAFVRRGPDQPTVSLPSVEFYAALGASWRAW
jgi:hypothetical protein